MGALAMKKSPGRETPGPRVGEERGQQVGSLRGTSCGHLCLAPQSPTQGRGGCPVMHGPTQGSPRKMLINCLRGLNRSGSSIYRCSPSYFPQWLWLDRSSGSWSSRVRRAEVGPDGGAELLLRSSFRGRPRESGAPPTPPGPVRKDWGAVLAELPRLTLTVALYRHLAGCQATARRPAGLRLRHRHSLPPAQAGAGSQVDPGRVLRRSPRVLIPHRLPSAAVGGGRPWCWMNSGPRSAGPPGLPWLASWWRRPWPCAGPVTGRRGARRPGHDRGSKRPWRPWTRRRSASVSR